MSKKLCKAVWLFLLVLFLPGCSKPKEKAIDNQEIAECYEAVYERTLHDEHLDDLERTKAIIECLGEHGYAAIDSHNQINMVNHEQVIEFNKDIEKGNESELILLCVLDSGGFVRYDMRTQDGTVQVKRSAFAWGEATFQTEYVKEYEAAKWKLTAEGYLFFGEVHVSGEDNPSGNAAFRVLPLDEKLRKFNRKYVMPIGYGLNNLWITQWCENDYKEVNFYDLYEPLYELKYGNRPFTESEKEGKSYEILALDFENLYQSFFDIDVSELREKMLYHESTGSYLYRSRGFHDRISTSNIPYPEVVKYVEHPDGTLTLTVHAVWPSKYNDRAFCHEVTLRPMDHGTFQYVSNKMISIDENVKITWYEERLTDAQWEFYYGGQE